jgi:AcrR family transcriptional regulator
VTVTPRAARPYDSPLRRAQAASTRDRIIEAACALLRGSSIRNWRSLTIRAVAEQAGVNERTVYRYFSNERGLRDAVMRQMEDEAGIELSSGLDLEDIAEVARRIFTQVSSFQFEPKSPLEPTLTEASLRQREALHDALAPWTGDWPAEDAAAVAALFDVLWSVGAYERLVADWQLDRERATEVLTWAIGLVTEAVRRGDLPSPGPASGRRRQRGERPT